jgi:hypothetical protein
LLDHPQRIGARQKGVDGVLSAEVIHRRDKAYSAADPTDRMAGKAGGDNRADYRVAYGEDRQAEPEEVGGGIQAQVEGYKEEAKGCEC